MMILKFLVATMAVRAWAAPTASNFNNDAYNFSPGLSEFYATVSRHIDDISHSDANVVCDISKAALPAQASGLPSPPAGSTLKYVAVGTGTQNYSCSDSTTSATPAQLGAVATLYDASCMAANYPDLLTIATNVVLNYALPLQPAAPLPPANLNLLGHHYFEDSTTPVFNLDTTSDHQYGIAISKKKAQLSAPEGSVVGQNNSGYGAVAWLYLTTTNGTVGNYTSVYRVNTAGGQPPATCQGMPDVFTIQYSANYFFYV